MKTSVILKNQRSRPIILSLKYMFTERKYYSPGVSGGGKSLDIDPVPSVDDAVELFRKSDGWRMDDVHFNLVWEQSVADDGGLSSELNLDELKQLGESVTYTSEKRPHDFNGPIVSVRRIYSEGLGLGVDVGMTNYFTLWGMPVKAPQLLSRKLKSLSEGGESKIPYGAYVASTVLLTGEEEPKLVTVVQTLSHGFYPGKISLVEEQMVPSDGNTFKTASRGVEEEVGIFCSPEGSLLLGIAAQKSIAYVGFDHLIKVPVTEEEFRDCLWPNRTDKTEGKAPLCFPLSVLYFDGDSVPQEIWKKFDVKHQIAAEGNLLLHPTALWRIQLLKEHLGIK